MPELFRSIRWTAIFRHPAGLPALVLVLGACLWSITGHREPAVEDTVELARTTTREAATVRPPAMASVRHLPQRLSPARVLPESRAIHADFETGADSEQVAVHAAGFNAAVTANAPAWLTGTIEVDE